MNKTVFSKKKAIPLMVIAGLCLAGVLQAQSARLSVSPGFTRLSVFDQNVSQLVYRGSLPSLGLAYERSGLHDAWHVAFQGAYGTFRAGKYPGRDIVFSTENANGQIDTVRVPVQGTNLNGSLSLGYLRWFRPAAGGEARLGAGASLTDQVFYPQGFVAPGLIHAATLTPEIRGEYGQGKGLLTISLKVPIVALVARSNYHNTVSRPGMSKAEGFLANSRWAGPGSFRQIDLEIGYRYRMGDRIGLGLGYQLRYLSDTLPRPLRLFQQRFQGVIDLYL